MLSKQALFVNFFVDKLNKNGYDAYIVPFLSEKRRVSNTEKFELLDDGKNPSKKLLFPVKQIKEKPMASEIKKPQLTDIEKLPVFFQELYEKWNHDNKNSTPNAVRNFIAELKLAHEMASCFLTRKTSLGTIFNALDEHPNLFPSAKSVSPRGRATAYFKAEHYIKSVAPKSVQPRRKMPTNIILIRAMASVKKRS